MLIMDALYSEAEIRIPPPTLTEQVNSTIKKRFTIPSANNSPLRAFQP